MGEHRSLRIARGARCEHDLREIVAGQIGLLERQVLAREIGQALDLVQGQTESLRACERLRRHDGRARARSLSDLLREVGHRIHVQRDEDRADTQRGEERDPVLRTVHTPDDDAVAPLESGVLQITRDPRHDVVQIAIRPSACAEARSDHERVFVAELPGRLLEDVVQRLHVALPLARERAQRLASPLPYRRIV